MRKSLDAFKPPTCKHTILLDMNGYDAFPALACLEDRSAKGNYQVSVFTSRFLFTVSSLKLAMGHRMGFNCSSSPARSWQTAAMQCVERFVLIRVGRTWRRASEIKSMNSVVLGGLAFQDFLRLIHY